MQLSVNQMYTAWTLDPTFPHLVTAHSGRVPILWNSGHVPILWNSGHIPILWNSGHVPILWNSGHILILWNLGHVPILWDSGHVPILWNPAYCWDVLVCRVLFCTSRWLSQLINIVVVVVCSVSSVYCNWLVGAGKYNNIFSDEVGTSDQYVGDVFVINSCYSIVLLPRTWHIQWRVKSRVLSSKDRLSCKSTPLLLMVLLSTNYSQINPFIP